MSSVYMFEHFYSMQLSLSRYFITKCSTWLWRMCENETMKRAMNRRWFQTKELLDNMNISSIMIPDSFVFMVPSQSNTKCVTVWSTVLMLFHQRHHSCLCLCTQINTQRTSGKKTGQMASGSSLVALIITLLVFVPVVLVLISSKRSPEINIAVRKSIHHTRRAYSTVCYCEHTEYEGTTQNGPST